MRSSAVVPSLFVVVLSCGTTARAESAEAFVKRAKAALMRRGPTDKYPSSDR